MKILSEMRVKRILVIAGVAVGLMMPECLLAQKKSASQPGQIAVMARASQDSIMLRWAPVNYQLWKHANQYGYIITRYTVMRDNHLLPVQTAQVMTPQPIRPLPLPAWEAVAQKSEKWGSIAAQALYGEKFEVTAGGGNSKGDVMAMYNQSQEQESRYGFALFSADQSYDVAKAAGLGWVDHTTKANEKYLYRIYMAVIPVGIKADTGFIYTGAADAQALPAPRELKVESLETGAMISWNKKIFDHIYNAWLLERSSDNGKTFTSVSKEPLINTQEGLTDKTNSFYRLDTGLIPEKTYIYRVKGLTAFGETGPASDTIMVTLYHRLEVNPVILETEMRNGQVYIRWRMPLNKAKIVRYDMERSMSPNKKYTVLNKSPLQEKDSIFVDPSPLNSNYYRVKATTKDGQVMHSFPHFVQQEDSIPPVAPVGAKGMIDKKGVVYLSWDENKEPDLFGYRVFRANSPKEEFVQVTRKATETNSFIDTITLKTLTKNVYYRIVALDKHYNPSEYSEILVLKRPDIIPPVSPFFTNVNASTEGVSLEWTPSGSEDVECHELMRTKDSVWETVRYIPITDSTHNYVDSTAIPGMKYMYQIIATDDSGLQGISKTVSAGRIDMGRLDVSKSLKVVIDRDAKQVKLSWQHKPGVDRIWMYRAVGDAPYKLYQTFTGAESSFADSGLLINTIYRYKLKMINTGNGKNGFTEEVIVNY